MSILKVARMGHPVLRRPARALDKSDLKNPVLQKFFDDMIDTMYEYHGVGLAGPQVHEGLRVFVAMLDEEPDEKSEAVVVVNPEITPTSTATEEGWEGCLSIPDIRGMVPRHTDVTVKALGWEGCLSIPDIRGMVPRHTDVTVKALDRTGKPIELRLTGFPARVAQHEADHLDGVLFFDRMRSMETLTFLEEFSRYWTKDEEP
jgi:peptide deformylase